jgi:hypothetical protein
MYLADMWCEDSIWIINKMNNKTYHTVGRVPNTIMSNGKECQ